VTSRTLQDRLDAIRAAFLERAPAEAAEIMHRTTQALIDSGQAERALGEGDRMPAFELPDSRGQTVRSADLLARGPLVLTFFRGHW
jgi:hypothetical protein